MSDITLNLIKTLLDAVVSADIQFCPICEKAAASFEPHGLNSRPQARCPNCGSLERHRLLWLVLNKVADLQALSGRTVLHFAPEACFRDRLSKIPGINYVTADLTPGRASVVADIRKLQFEDNTFDLIICSHVLEHVTEDRQAMRELHRVLNTSGKAFIMVPMNRDFKTTLEDPSFNTPELREKHYGQHDHVRYYGLDFQSRLVEAGMIVDAISGLTFPDDLCRSRCALSRESVYVCSKQNELPPLFRTPTIRIS